MEEILRWAVKADTAFRQQIVAVLKLSIEKSRRKTFPLSLQLEMSLLPAKQERDRSASF